MARENLFKRLVKRAVQSLPSDWLKSVDTLSIFDDPFSSKSNSGVNVTPTTALTHSAVWAAVRLLGDTVASLPFQIVERTKDGRRLAGYHPLYSLIHSEPNRMMTSYTFRQLMMTHLNLVGNFFAFIVFGEDERPTELVPIDPATVTVYADNGRLFYKVNEQLYQDWEILHVKGLSMDGIIGLSPIAYARETIGGGISAQNYSAELMGNGITATGVIEMDGMPKADQVEDLRKMMAKKFRGDRKTTSSGIAILYGGMKFNRIAIPPVDAQFLEQRKFSVEDIARIMRVPNHMIGDLSHATFSNIEHQAIEFVQFSLMPWVKAIEMEFDRKIFREDEKKKYSVKLNVDGLLRGDIVTRAQLYQSAINSGWMTRDEARQLENMNALSDGYGDIPLVPVNLTTMTKLQATDTNNDGEGNEDV